MTSTSCGVGRMGLNAQLVTGPCPQALASSPRAKIAYLILDLQPGSQRLGFGRGLGSLGFQPRLPAAHPPGEKKGGNPSDCRHQRG